MSLPLSHADFAAFLAHIAEEPGDPFRRMVFANWLQDHDDPRAPWFRDEAHVWQLTWSRWLVPDLDDCIVRLLEARAEDQYPLDNWHMEMLLTIGPPTVAVLRKWMRVDETRHIYWTYDLLRQFPPPVLRPVAELIPLLRSSDPFAMYEALVDLGWHGPAASEAVPELIAHFNRVSSQGNEQVAVLGRIGSPVDAIIPALMQWLGIHVSLEEDVERVVLELQPPPALVYAHLQFQDARRASASLRILAAAAQGDHTWVIHSLIEYPRPRVFDAAMEVAARDPSLSQALLDRFGAMRQHANPEMRRFAHRIGLLHSDREGTVRLLAEAMASPDPQIVADAERGMLNTQTESLEMVAEVVERLIATRVSVPGSFVTGLRTMGKRALPVLRLLLGDGSASIRRFAAMSLYDAGPRGKLLLQDALEDPRKVVREAAEAGLR